jgi:hypothetical protein
VTLAAEQLTLPFSASARTVPLDVYLVVTGQTPMASGLQTVLALQPVVPSALPAGVTLLQAIDASPAHPTAFPNATLAFSHDPLGGSGGVSMAVAGIAPLPGANVPVIDGAGLFRVDLRLPGGFIGELALGFPTSGVAPGIFDTAGTRVTLDGVAAGSVRVVPEPATILVAASGLAALGIGLAVRRARRAVPGK